ncbi:MAG: DNA recombination/repair protein RecA [Deltaproteobacteria bacterium]|nr:DNA recombination/repair protein RecA [Deltaproteobacteria bacterium]
MFGIFSSFSRLFKINPPSEVSLRSNSSFNQSIPSGIPLLDSALGCGGYPRGRITEILGNESSGKSTLVLHAIAACQAQNGIAVLFDSDCSINVRLAKEIGVDTERLLISHIDSANSVLEMAQILISSRSIDLIAIDSIPTLQFKTASAISPTLFINKLAEMIHRSQTAILIVDFQRNELNSSAAMTKSLAKYHASLRILVSKIHFIQSKNQIIGHRMKVEVIKNKISNSLQKVDFDVYYEKVGNQKPNPFKEVLD